MGKIIGELIAKVGGRFSTELGIKLDTKSSSEIFKWWLASLLFGARISERIAINTYRKFESKGILSPQKILDTGWDGLVSILDAGGYVRYDFKTATKLLDVMGRLVKEYQGDLNFLHQVARDSSDLEYRLKGLGKGIGDTTVNIFLRELRGVWEKANPVPQELVLIGAKNLGLLRVKSLGVLEDLKSVWGRQMLKGFSFPDFEVALLRLAKNYCRKKRCAICPVKELCVHPVRRGGKR